MSRVWGREETTGWPTRQPAFTITAFLVAAVSVVAVWCYRYETVWTPLERYWYPAFANMHLMHGIGAKTGTYQLLGKIPMGCEVAFLDSWNIGPLCFWREI